MKTLVFLILAASLGIGAAIWLERRARPVVVIPAPTRAVSSAAANPAAASLHPSGPDHARYATPWAALRAHDHEAFVHLLRTSGCPEETVRLFAVAAVGREIQQRLEAPERARLAASPYWQLPAAGEQPQSPAQMLQQRAILEARLSDLLHSPGAGLRQEFIDFFRSPDWLTISQRTELNTLLARQRQELAHALPEGCTATMDQAAHTEFLQIRAQHRAELERLLGARGLADYEARESLEADYVRQHLPAASDEDEFRLLVAAARDVGFTESDVVMDQLPEEAKARRPSLRQRILDRFRELANPDRAAEFQKAAAAEERQAAEELRTETERRLVSELQSLADAAGVQLDSEEAHSLNLAIRQRETELERDLGDLSQTPQQERNARFLRARAEFDKIAVDQLGDRGLAVVEQMWRKLEAEHQTKK